jgi:hypothetical protein
VSIKLTVLVKRNPALSVEDFHELWRDHGRMIANQPDLARHILRYEQHHRAIADYKNGGAFDGMVLQWFETYRNFIGFLEDPKYAELVQPDEQRLLDMDGIVVLFTEAAETFIG